MDQKGSEIFALCLAKRFDFKNLQESFLTSQRCALYRDVLCVEWHSGEFFLFEYGVVVFWKLTHDERQAILDKLTDFLVEPLATPVEDEFTYELNAPMAGLRNDHLRLPDDDVMSRVAVSHGIAQSIKLARFEQQAQETIARTEHIPESIAKIGSTQLSRKQIAQMRGQLFLAKSNIILHYDLLDAPEFFWEYPELEPYYTMVSGYLEINQRLDVLGKRLETIHELFEMMADEQKHKHSSLLEWIIIWLIAIEIVIFVIKDIFGWL